MNRTTIKKYAKLSLRWVRNILLFFVSLSLFFVLLYKYAPVYTLQMTLRQASHIFVKETKTLQHQWKPLNEISPSLQQSVIASEDHFFLEHDGFDFYAPETNPGEISRSRYHWKTGTLSQQTARMVFLMPGDNYFNSIMESLFTVLIEFVWGKERILEVYLNSVEFGDNIFGAEAIAQTCFDVSAKDLSLPQAALITVSIDSPKEFDASKPTTYMLRRQAKIIGLVEKMLPVAF